YDPSFSKDGDDGHMRVIPYEDDFASRSRHRLARTALILYGTPLVLLAGSLLVGFVVRAPPVRATAITLFFLVGGVTGLVFLRVVQPLTRAGGSANGSRDALLPLVRPLAAVPWEVPLVVGLILVGGARVVFRLLKSERRPW